MFQNARIVGRGVNPQEYHEHDIPRGNPDFPMSPSALKLFAPCAKKWVEGYTPKETKAHLWGNLLDCLLLTPDQFEARYAIIPEDAPRKPTSKQRDARKPSADTLLAIEWWDDFDETSKDKVIIDDEMHELASAAILKLRADTTVRAFIDASNKQVWVAGEWHDKGTGLIVPVRCLIDLEPTPDSLFGKCLGDLKATRSAALFPFLRDAFNFGHHIQAAFDLDLYRAAVPDCDRTEWCLIVQENTEPWLVAKRAMTDSPEQPENFLELGRVSYRRLLQNYCICLKTGKWPNFEEMAELDKDLSNHVAQGWFYMTARPFMLDWMPSRFELPTDDGEVEEQDENDIPT